MSITADASPSEPGGLPDVTTFDSWCEFLAALPAGDVDAFLGLTTLDPSTLSQSDAVAALMASQKMQARFAALDQDLLVAAAGAEWACPLGERPPGRSPVDLHGRRPSH